MASDGFHCPPGQAFDPVQKFGPLLVHGAIVILLRENLDAALQLAGTRKLKADGVRVGSTSSQGKGDRDSPDSHSLVPQLNADRSTIYLGNVGGIESRLPLVRRQVQALSASL